MRELNINELELLNQKFGNGFYLLDSDVFLSNYRELKKAFEEFYSNFNIAYSYKTNYIPRLGKIVNSEGGFAEVVSDMELEIARLSGVRTNKIIWNGPVKNEDALEAFLLDGGTANIDNLEEWKLIAGIAKKNQSININVGVRCNFDVGDGVVSRFGIDIESKDFHSVCSEISTIKNVKLISIQCHFAKRNPDYWDKRTETMLSVYDQLVAEYGLRPERIDLGGALSGHMSDDFAKQIHVSNCGYMPFAESSAKLVAEHFNNSDFKPMLLIEPGTAVAADCMRAVFKVVNIKKVAGKAIATVYGSQKNISMSGINPPITVVHGRGKQDNFINLDFAGYTCIENDYLYRNYTGALGIGDYIILHYCGSYSVVMKPPFIFPNFPVIDISNGVENLEVIKEAESFDDLFHTYNF